MFRLMARCSGRLRATTLAPSTMSGCIATRSCRDGTASWRVPLSSGGVQVADVLADLRMRSSCGLWTRYGRYLLFRCSRMTGWRDHHLPTGGSPVHRQAARAG